MSKLSVGECPHDRFNPGILEICESGCGKPRLYIEGHKAADEQLASAVEVITHYADSDNWICNPAPPNGCMDDPCPHDEKLMLTDGNGYDKAAEWLKEKGYE